MKKYYFEVYKDDKRMGRCSVVSTSLETAKQAVFKASVNSNNNEIEMDFVFIKSEEVK